jgi:hypothetical protein
MNRTVVLLLCVAFIALVVKGQDYAEYARGAGMARRRNNRLDNSSKLDEFYHFQY